MKSKHIHKLKELEQEYLRKRYPTVPDHCRYSTAWKDTTANGLEKCICEFINLSGGFARRVKNMGRVLDNTKVVKDVMGINRTIGSKQYIKGTGELGTADISSSIPIIINGEKIGLVVEWEVKIAKDIQSDVQKKYENNIKETGGYYFIVKSFDCFYEKYIELLNKF